MRESAARSELSSCVHTESREWEAMEKKLRKKIERERGDMETIRHYLYLFV